MKINEKALEAAWSTLSPDGATQTDLIDAGNLRAAITAYLTAIEEAGFVVVPRQLMWDVVATIEEKLVRDAIEEALSAIAAKDGS